MGHQSRDQTGPPTCENTPKPLACETLHKRTAPSGQPVSSSSEFRENEVLSVRAQAPNTRGCASRAAACSASASPPRSCCASATWTVEEAALLWRSLLSCGPAARSQSRVPREVAAAQYRPSLEISMWLTSLRLSPSSSTVYTTADGKRAQLTSSRLAHRSAKWLDAAVRERLSGFGSGSPHSSALSAEAPPPPPPPGGASGFGQPLP
mmetsp:Transcript_128869/g.412681  ORF Transcript_128869/g.412681 Transcript_128869/m.412681 type:complete len:208 (+) Transcript_128869:660-1283(+)